MLGRLSLLALTIGTLLGARSAVASTTITGGNLGNQTWTPAGSPYIVSGDATIQAGATLTIQAGTEVQVTATDAQGSGVDTSRVELTVQGTLSVDGTAANPVTFHLQPGMTGSWRGIIITPSAAGATFSGASISNAVNGITSQMTSSPLSITASSIQTFGSNGVIINNGTATFDGVRISGSTATNGIFLGSTSGAGVTASIVNTIITGANIGINVSSTTVLMATFANCTLHANSAGLYLSGAPGGSSLTATNLIISNSVGNGVTSQAGTFLATTTISYSDVWGSGSANFFGPITCSAGCISANPQYVSSTDFHLQASSVCIDSGTATAAPDHDFDGHHRPADGDGVSGAAFDMGAYELGSTAGDGGSGGAGGTTGADGGAGTDGGGGGSAGASGDAAAGGAGGGGGTTGGAGGSQGADASSTGGNGGASGTGGTGGTGGTVADGGSDERPAAASSGGCGCATGGSTRSSAGLLLVTAALLVARRRKRTG